MHGDVVAIHVDVQCFVGLSLVDRSGGQRHFLTGEGHANRSIAFGDQSHTLMASSKSCLLTTA